MFEKYLIIEDDLNLLKGDYFIGFFVIMITTLPNFLFLIGHTIMTFTDLYVLKNYTGNLNWKLWNKSYHCAYISFAMNVAAANGCLI